MSVCLPVCRHLCSKLLTVHKREPVSWQQRGTCGLRMCPLCTLICRLGHKPGIIRDFSEHGESLGNSVHHQGKIVTKIEQSRALLTWADCGDGGMTYYIAGIYMEWPLMKVIIMVTSCYVDLWKSKFKALEKPGRLQISRPSLWPSWTVNSGTGTYCLGLSGQYSFCWLWISSFVLLVISIGHDWIYTCYEEDVSNNLLIWWNYDKYF